MYEYRGEVQRVVDGDTVHVRVDLGCDVRLDLTLRLAGINAPEMSTPEGARSKTWLENRLRWPDHELPSSGITVRTVKDRREKYGRYLAYLIDGDGNINDDMVHAGMAVPYDGGRR